MRNVTGLLLVAAVASTFASHALANDPGAQQYFSMDFSNKSSITLNAATGTAPDVGGGHLVQGYGNAPALVATNARPGVANVFGQVGVLSGTVGTGWAWNAPAKLTFDAKNQIFFVRQTLITDAWGLTTGVNGFNCDVFSGTNQYGTNPQVFANSTGLLMDINQAGSGQTYTRYYNQGKSPPFPADIANPNANAANTPILTDTFTAADQIAYEQAQANRTITTTQLWRDQDATHMTVETYGGNQALKTTFPTPARGIFTSFGGVSPTVAPNTGLSNPAGAVFRNGVTVDNSQTGFVKFEVGVTSRTDFNMDYKTTINGDMTTMVANLGKTSGATFFQGDANNDGAVTIAGDGTMVVAALPALDSQSAGVPTLLYEVATGAVKVKLNGSNPLILILDSASGSLTGTEAADKTLALGGVKDLGLDASHELAWANLGGFSFDTMSAGFLVAPGTPASDLSLSYQFAGSAVSVVPEPASLGLLTLGALGLMARRRRMA